MKRIKLKQHRPLSDGDRLKATPSLCESCRYYRMGASNLRTTERVNLCLEEGRIIHKKAKVIYCKAYKSGVPFQATAQRI